MTQIDTSLRPRSQATNAYDLLNDLCNVVRAEPARLYMDTWAVAPWRLENFVKEENMTRIPECGTAACVAGWTVALARPKRFTEELAADVAGHFSTLAQDLLLPPYDFSQPQIGQDPYEMRKDLVRLFESFPPEEFKHGSDEYVDYVVQRIKKFQQKWATTLRAIPIEPES